MNSTACFGPDAQTGSETGQIDKEELLRKGEILHKQVMAHEGPMRIGHHALVFREAHRPQRRGRQRDRSDLGAGSGVPDQDAIQPAEQQFIESVDEAAFAIQIKAQAVDLQSWKLTSGAQPVQPALRRKNRWP